METGERRRQAVEVGIVMALFAPAIALLASGTAILWLWLFPVVECSGDSCLIGQNPVGWWLTIAGLGTLPASAYLTLHRNRRQNRGTW